MGLLICLGATCAGLAAEPEPLVKVGDFHLKRGRFGAAAVAEGDYVYVLGGGDRAEFYGDIERFNVKTHAVVRITDELIPRRHHAAAVVNHKLYIFGGWNNAPGFAEPEPRVEVFDFATGKLSVGAPMPTPRAHTAAIARQGAIYTIGGEGVLRNNTLVEMNLMEIYDPTANAWRQGPPMPTPREAHAALVADFIMVAGGYSAHAAQAKVEFFLPQENEWRALPDLGEAVSACSVAFLGHHLFLFGNFGSESHVVAYDLRNRTSRLIKPGFKPARHTAAVAHNGFIYVVGGNIDPDLDSYDNIQVFAPTETK